MIFDQTADLYHLSPDPNDPNYEYYRIQARGLSINIQPESPEYTVAAGETFGRLFRGFVPWPTGSGIRIGDKISISGTSTWSGMAYIVRGVADWGRPPLPHYELSLVEAGV